MPEQVKTTEINKARGVVILGYAPSSRDLAPVRDESLEVWGLNNLYTSQLPRWTRWFDIHSRESLFQKNRDEAHFNWLKQAHGKPIYMQDQYPEFPCSVPYPIEQMVAMFGDYFTNSISYMLALAIAEDFKTIYLYGVDMALDSEYGEQKPSCEYFVGIARGRGINVIIPDESDLLKSAFRYGYHSGSARVLARKAEIRRRELRGRIQALNNQIAGLQQQLFTLMGAADDCEFWRKNEFNLPTQELPPIEFVLTPEQLEQVQKSGKVSINIPMRRG